MLPSSFVFPFAMTDSPTLRSSRLPLTNLPISVLSEQKIILEEPYDSVNRDVSNINIVLQGDLTSPESEKFKNIGES